MCDYSADLENWTQTTIEDITTLRRETAEILIHEVHNVVQRSDRSRVVRYPIGDAVRYFRMPRPLDRIYRISLTKNGERIGLREPKLNNLMPYKRDAAYVKDVPVAVKSADWREGCYLAVALEGVRGAEGAYAVIEDEDGTLYGCPDRAPGYNSNIWECNMYLLDEADHHYTYYFPLPRELRGKNLTVHVVGVYSDHTDYGVDVYLCDGKLSERGKEIDL